MSRLFLLAVVILMQFAGFAQEHIQIKGESGYQRIELYSDDRAKVTDTRIFKGTSDIDNPNFSLGKPQKNRYALIIGNEKYRHQSRVKYAERDANTFSKYANKAFLIPEENITIANNATFEELKKNFRLLSAIPKYDKNAQLYVFYAGHGAPDKTGSFLLGTDQDADNVVNKLYLDRLYEMLMLNNPKNVFVFLDACFSGNNARAESKDEYLSFNSRSVRIVTKQKYVIGPLLVFSSSEDNQTSNAYDSQGHGIFSYFLMKNILDANGKISFGILFQNTVSKVGIQSLKLGLEQKPTKRIGNSIEKEWFQWNLDML